MSCFNCGVWDIIGGEPKQFLGMIATVDYNSAEREQAREWVEESYNTDQATMIIGDVKFTMYCPSEYVRILILEKNL